MYDLASLSIFFFPIKAKNPFRDSTVNDYGYFGTAEKYLGKFFISYSILAVGLLTDMKELIISLRTFCLDVGF